MKKLLISLSILLLASCASSQTQPNEGNLIESLNQDDYAVLIPFESSPVRSYHGTYLGKADFMEVGARLLTKTKSVFDPKTYFISEGQVLTPSLLGQLVKRESSDNPYGLNPPSGSNFQTGINEVSVLDAVLVADVVETDFYTGSSMDPVLSGIAFAMVLNDQISQADGTLVPVDPQRLYEYASDMGRKLERFIRTLADMEDIPVYIALYSTESLDSYLPGKFIGEGTFDGRSGQFSQTSETWVMFPSSVASTLDPQTDASFSSFRSKIVDFIPETIGVIGEARYVNNDLDFLRLSLSIQAKTYTEVFALAQYTASLLEGFEKGNYGIIVKINSIDETLVLIERDRLGNLSLISPY